MDKSAQIDILRKEHQIAVSNYDFDRAELISRQISRLRTEISREKENMNIGYMNLELDEEREKINSKTARNDANLMNELVNLQQRFHRRYKELQNKHTQQLTDLHLEHTMALERELSRPIPEADEYLEKSKMYGKAHNYAAAKQAYQDAMRIKRQVTESRRNECDSLFARSEQQLKDRQAREIRLLEEKQETGKSNVNIKYAAQKSIINNTLKAKEFKATLRTMNEKKFSSSSRLSKTGNRRSNSVSKNLRGSRLSQGSSRF